MVTYLSGGTLTSEQLSEPGVASVVAHYASLGTDYKDAVLALLT